MSNNEELPTWLLTLISWVFCAYFLGTFLLFFHIKADFSQSTVIPSIYYLYLILGVSFAFLPFMNKIKIGTFLELERQIEETKNEIKDFKEEIRQMVSVVSHHTVNVYPTPKTDQLSQAKETLVERSDSETLQESEKIKDEISLESEDTIIALAKTRIKLESMLRKILGKAIKSDSEIQRNIKYASFRQLYKHFLKEYPDYANLEKSFTYVGQICNAAIHGQTVSVDQASEALDIGGKLMALLNKIVSQENTID